MYISVEIRKNVMGKKKEKEDLGRGAQGVFIDKPPTYKWFDMAKMFLGCGLETIRIPALSTNIIEYPDL